MNDYMKRLRTINLDKDTSPIRLYLWSKNYGREERTPKEIRKQYKRHNTFFDVFGYIHRDLALSIYPYNCPFDSGWIGLIKVHKSFIAKHGIIMTKWLITDALTLKMNVYNGYDESGYTTIIKAE